MQARGHEHRDARLVDAGGEELPDDRREQQSVRNRLVMSQMRMQALRLPRASSTSGLAVHGRGQGLFDRGGGGGEDRHRRLADHARPDPSGSVTESVPRP